MLNVELWSFLSGRKRLERFFCGNVEMKLSLGDLLVKGGGVGLRLLLSASSIPDFLVDRVEVSTPANSFLRLMEGIDLNRKGISPYAGDIFHEMPLVLYGFDVVVSKCQFMIPLILALMDVMGAIFLAEAAYNYVKKVNATKPGHSEVDLQSLFPGDPSKVALLVQLCYLFNPFVIASCVAQTTSVFHNLCLAITFWALVTSRHTVCLSALALASYQGLYPVLLLVPVTLNVAQLSSRRGNWLMGLCRSVGTFAGIWAGLLYLSSSLFGSWSFIEATYGFLASVPDLTPNVGLFWYFFTEMFDHFRLFFLWVFQVNLLVYLVPLALCLRDDPYLLFNQLLMLMAVFKSYPSVADAGLYLALLPTWRHLYLYVRHGFVVGCAVVCCAVLAPVMWFLWIHAGSANANFYFAITLVYSTAQIFLLTDILYAHLRRQIHLKHGLEPMISGRKAKVVLQ